MRYLIVDGMLSGTGIRDAVEGGYINIIELGLSSVLISNIVEWQARYENAHFRQFSDLQEISNLDDQGLQICKQIQHECPEVKIEYFSAGKMKKILNT